jgi:hypothetical protein
MLMFCLCTNPFLTKKYSISWLVFNANFSNTNYSSWPLTFVIVLSQIHMLYTYDSVGWLVLWRLTPLKISNHEGPSWPWSYGGWIYNYLCNQCLSTLMLWVRLPLRAKCTTLCDKVYVTCGWLVGFMAFYATFNNISTISWRSVLLVEETGGPRENHRPAASHINFIT